jgi:hypothetical protein
MTSQPAKWADSFDGRHVVVANGQNLLVVDSQNKNPDKVIPVGVELADSFFESATGQPKNGH